jgi:hypothetical protein
MGRKNKIAAATMKKYSQSNNAGDLRPSIGKKRGKKMIVMRPITWVIVKIF